MRVPAKEITESFGAFRATANWMGWSALQDPTITCLVPADGHRPRTAALFAYRTKWQVLSADPDGHWPDQATPPQRLELVTKPVEQLHGTIQLAPHSTAVIVAVHAHSQLMHAVWAFAPVWKKMVVVSVPCCVPQKLQDPQAQLIAPNQRYRDNAVWSPENEILIWEVLPNQIRTQAH